jgi:hypothetical protein
VKSVLQRSQLQTTYPFAGPSDFAELLRQAGHGRGGGAVTAYC